MMVDEDYFNAQWGILNKDIKYMLKLPTGTISQEEHYFRNKLNIEYGWSEFESLQKKLPSNLQWISGVPAAYHQNTALPSGENRKYVSSDGHFEMIFNDNNISLSEKNAYSDMGTYNYYAPSDYINHGIL